MTLQLNELASIKRTVQGLARGPSESDFINLRQRLEGAEKSDSLMRKTLTEHDKKIKQLKLGNNNPTENARGPVDDLADSLKQLRSELEDHVLYANKEISTLNVLLTKKANLTEI